MQAIASNIEVNNKSNKIVSVIIIFKDLKYLEEGLSNVLLQTYKDINLYIVVYDDNNIPIYDLIEKIIKHTNKEVYFEIIDKKLLLKDNIIVFLDNLQEKYSVIINGEDINDQFRIEKQINFMETNEEINICSCMENSINNIKEKQGLMEYDNFIKASEIDSCICGGYIPLDLYTITIRNSFLKKVIKLLESDIHDELECLLFLLKYTCVEKIPEVLYYFRTQRIPYDECLNLDCTIESINKIALFNKSRYIENRRYLKEMLGCNKNIINKLNYNENVLIIIKELFIGGTETYILNLIKYLRKLNIDTYIVSSGGISEEEFKLNNIKIYKIHVKYFNYEKSNFIYEVIEPIIRENKIKIICCHSNNEIAICRECSLRFNIPWILTLHGIFYDEEAILTKPYPNEIIAVSLEVKKYYNNVSHVIKNFSLIYNGIEFDNEVEKGYLRKIIGANKDDDILIYASRLSAGKAPLALEFLEAFYKLAQKYENLYAVILGDGNRKIMVDNHIKDINKKLNSKRVFSLGAVYDIDKYFSDCLLAAATGRTALEAIRSETIVLSIGLSGFKGIINENNIEEISRSNFGDHNSNSNRVIKHKEDLFYEMEYVIDNKDNMKSICEFCKKYCKEKFNIINMTHKIKKIYERYF